MLSIQNEDILRESGPINLSVWRSHVGRGTPLDQIMEEALNHATAKARKADEDEDAEEELSDARAEAATYQRRAAARAEEANKAQDALDAERKAHRATADRLVEMQSMLADTRAQLSAALWLVPGSVPLGQLREDYRAFAADLAELERLRAFEADRLEQDARMAEEKAAAPSAEIPEEMFERGPIKSESVGPDGALKVEYYSPNAFARVITPDGEMRLKVDDMTPEQRAEFEAYLETIKAAGPNEPVRFTPIADRKRLDAIALQAGRIAEGSPYGAHRRLGALIASMAAAVEPRA